MAPRVIQVAFCGGLSYTADMLANVPGNGQSRPPHYLGGLFRGLLATGVALAATVGGCSKSTDRKTPKAGLLNRPNIVLITVESLRTDHVGSYGYDRDTTPTIDALAREATLYENAFAVTSWTLTSHASIFTGLYPSAHNVVRERDRLNEAYKTMAEFLADYGYQTAAVVSGPYLKKAHGLDRGFHYFDEQPITRGKMKDAHADVTNAKMEAGINRFLDEVRGDDRPFFLFLYYWDPHYQYIPPSPYDAMFVPEDAEAPKKLPDFHRYFQLGKHITPAQLEYVKAQYDGEIRCTDGYLKRFFDRLRQLDLWDETAVILTADHAEQFFEHGFLGHKYDLHVESLHVPLIVKLPGQAEARRDPRMVSLMDLFPTVLDLGRCRLPDALHGQSLLADARVPLDPTFYELISVWYAKQESTGKQWTETQNWYAVREGDYKLIWQELADEVQLYNLREDPRELHPIAEGQNDRKKALRALIDDWRAQMKQIADGKGAADLAPLTPEDEERLRSLGYITD